MTYLVVGGGGFIGSTIVEMLRAEGHAVRVLDNFATGKRSNLPADIDLVEADITDLAAIRPAFAGIDGVFHLAARPSVPFSVEHPVESTQVNIMGTVNVLEAARQAGVRRVVYSASSSAYGIQPELPQRVDMRSDPLSPYAVQKYVGELFCRQFAMHYGLETVSLRYFNVYGPRMNDVGAYVPVFVHFLRQKREGKPIVIFGDGETTRDFTHVADVARANLAAMCSAKVGKGEVLNAGAGASTSLNRIAEIFGGPVDYQPPRAGDVPRSQSDSSQTKTLLDWAPQVAFEDGLRAWMRSEGLEPAA